MGSQVSRWTLRYFAVAVISFLAGEASIALGWSYPVASLSSPATLVTVHLITIGWLSLLMLGALHQFVPVIAVRPLASERASAFTLSALLLGLLGMEIGFLGLGESTLAELVPFAPSLLPAGGALALTGIVVAAVNLGAAFRQARPLPLPARFVIVGLAFLLITALMGLTLALALAFPGAWDPALLSYVLADGLPLHLLAGLVGWFTLTAMGVAYKLLAMFTLAPEDRGTVGRWSFRLSAGGLGLAWVSSLFAAQPEPLAQSVQLARLGWLLLGGGISLYLGDMIRLFRQRRRRALELNARFGGWALGALAAALLLAGAAAALGAWRSLAPLLAYLLLFGWLSGLGLSQAYKIIPFLTWLEKFGPQLGRGPAVRVQDLVDERRATPWFVLFFAATVLGCLCALTGRQELWRLAVGANGAATLAIAVELWRARKARPTPLQRRDGNVGGAEGAASGSAQGSHRS